MVESIWPGEKKLGEGGGRLAVLEELDTALWAGVSWDGLLRYTSPSQPPMGWPLFSCKLSYVALVSLDHCRRQTRTT